MSKKITGQNIINLIRACLIIAIAAAVLIVCSRILTLKSEDGISQFRSFYKQPEDSIDVLFMGSSHTYCNISTGLIWENYGIPTFNLGGAEAPTWSSYYQMKEAIKYQHPKVMAFEVSTSAIRPGLEPPEFWIEDNDYGMKWNSNRIDLLKVQTGDWLFKRIVNPLDTMHGRYNELTADDFIDKNNSVNYKGFDSRGTVFPCDVPDVSGVDQIGEITERADEYLHKIIELCRDNDIELWFFITPYAISESDQAIYNYIESVANEEGIPYVNFNDAEHIQKMGFDYKTDMADALHVNFSGSEKFSKYLAQYLRDRYDLPDRRNDSKYVSWDVDALTLRMERADHYMAGAESDAEFLGFAKAENYLTFISFGEGADRQTLPDEVMSGLVALGIPINELLCGNAVVLCNGQIIYSGVAQNFRMSTSVDRDRFLFYRTDSEDEARAFETFLRINKQNYEFTDKGIEIYCYDLSNSCLGGSRQIMCQE